MHRFEDSNGHTMLPPVTAEDLGRILLNEIGTNFRRVAPLTDAVAA